MVQIYRRGESPFWYFDMPDPLRPGKRIRKSTKETNEKKAQRAAFAALEAAQNPQQVVRERTLREAVDDFVAALRADGKESYANTCAAIARKLFGETHEARRFKLDPARPLSSLAPDDVRALKLARAREGNGPATIANELRLLRAAVYAARQEGYKVGEIGKWGVPKTPAKLRYLSPAEAARLLAHLSPDRVLRTNKLGEPIPLAPHIARARRDNYDLCALFLLTGCRWDELSGMTRGQVDLDRAIIRVRGKGAKLREIPLVPEALAIMRRRIEAHPLGLLFPSEGWNRDGKSTAGKKRWGSSKAIIKAMDEAGLNDEETVKNIGRANIHTLRHTYASWLRQRGLGLDELQHLLGHSTLQMTMRYAKLDATATAARVEAGLSGLLQQPVQQTAPHDAGVPTVTTPQSDGTLPSRSV